MQGLHKLTIGRTLARSLGVLCLLPALLACSASAQTETPTQTNPPPGAGVTPTPTPTPVAGGAPVENVPPTPDRCPTDTTTFELAAAHTFWTDTGMGKWNWEAFGSIPVIVTKGGAVDTASQGIVPGRQFGTFSSVRNSCTFEAPAEVHTSVSGVCASGVLKLEITEDWQMGTYDWQCDDKSFQAQVPPLGVAVHPDVNFPLQGEGSYTFEIPWGGGGGTKMYTLYPHIEPVPLVTP